MPPATTTLQYVRDFLVAEGLVRIPRVPGADTIYPFWMSPPDGARPPYDADLDGATVPTVERNPDLVVSAFRVQGQSVGRDQTWHKFENVELQLRGRTYPLIEDFYNRLRPRFIDKNVGETKRNWNMAGLQVIESLIAVELDLLDVVKRGETSTGTGVYVWTYTVELQFEIFQT